MPVLPPPLLLLLRGLPLPPTSSKNSAACGGREADAGVREAGEGQGQEQECQMHLTWTSEK